MYTIYLETGTIYKNEDEYCPRQNRQEGIRKNKETNNRDKKDEKEENEALFSALRFLSRSSFLSSRFSPI
jgi:hypothetical protein